MHRGLRGRGRIQYATRGRQATPREPPPIGPVEAPAVVAHAWVLVLLGDSHVDRCKLQSFKVCIADFDG